MNVVLPPRQFEFVHHRLENFILVENAFDGAVVVRAALNNFSESRKGAFIREMAAEGFIPDEPQWFSDADLDHARGRVRWMVDHSWVGIRSVIRKRATRAVMTMLVMAGSLWVALMGAAVPRAG